MHQPSLEERCWNREIMAEQLANGLWFLAKESKKKNHCGWMEVDRTRVVSTEGWGFDKVFSLDERSSTRD